MGSFENDFTEGRMSMDGFAELLQGVARGNHRHQLLNEVGSVCTINVPRNQAFLFIEDEFDHAVRFAHGECFSIGAEKAFTRFDVPSPLFAGSFGESHTRGFGLGEDGGRNEVETNLIGRLGDVVEGALPLEGGRMSQLAEAVDIAHGINTRHVGLQIVVDSNTFCVIVDAGLFQLQSFGTRRAPHSHQHNVGFYGGGVALAVVVNEELLFLRFDGCDSR